MSDKGTDGKDSGPGANPCPPGGATQAKPLPAARDMQRFFPGFSPEVILDVGANVGRTAERWAEAFPEARLHAFEPMPGLFRQLSARLAGQARIACWNLALGDADAAAEMVPGRGPTEGRIARPEEATAQRIPVRIRRGDSFCAEHGIARIGVLKIDTEGYDPTWTVKNVKCLFWYVKSAKSGRRGTTPGAAPAAGCV